jgi:hypothetical protein
MPRGRKPLSEKQERVLVQCQLMGLTTADLVTISNRLKALDVEREFKSRVSEVIEGFTWNIKDKRNFTVTDRAGTVYECKCYADYSSRDWTMRGRDFAKITITRPGTRQKPKIISDHRIVNPWNDPEIVSVCPEGSKYLYRVMRDIKSGRFK